MLCQNLKDSESKNLELHKYLLRRPCLKSLYLYTILRTCCHYESKVTWISKHYYFVFALIPHISAYEAENLLNKSQAKIYWKNLHRLFIESFMKIYSSDHTNSYPSRLEPHNLELFRINVTNRLEIFCEFRSSMFSVLRKNISFHESALSPPHFWQLATIGFLVEQLNGLSGCRDFGSESS